MNIEIVPSPRPETPEQERDHWFAVYREVMDELEPFHVGSPTALETLRRILPELQEFRAQRKAQSEVVATVFHVEVLWEGSDTFATIGRTDNIAECRRRLQYELPAIDIPLVDGFLSLKRASYKSVRFVKVSDD